MENTQIINNILKSLKIKAECVTARVFDNYHFYDIKLAPETKLQALTKRGEEISLAMRATSPPTFKVVREKGIVRMAFSAPRTKRLNLLDLFTNRNVPNGDLICLLGQTVEGNNVWMDLAQNPHMIIAGTTGSGKSVLMHNIIANIFNYNNCILHLVDPKNIEFDKYDNIMPSVKVHHTYNEALCALDSVIVLMENRYEMIRGGHSIANLPYVVLIIDEFADLIMQDKDDEFYLKIVRLAQKCRAARISIIIAAQRPSANIISGTIKANFPCRIACKVASHIDSKVILDCVGAEHLMGHGDALLKDSFRNLERFQVAYISKEDVIQTFSM